MSEIVPLVSSFVNFTGTSAIVPVRSLVVVPSVYLLKSAVIVISSPTATESALASADMITQLEASTPETKLEGLSLLP